MRIVLLILIVFFAFIAGAQQSKKYSFRHFTTINGLASNAVSTLLQDKDGYIWMGTQNGLQRYDGNNFITFKNRSDDSTTIPSNFIPYMYEDSKKNLWLVGDNNEVGMFDTRRFVFKPTPIVGDTQKYYLSQHIAELPTGELMLVRVNGTILRYDPVRNQFVNGRDLLHLPPQWKCTHITWDSVSKKLWMGCDSGLVLYNPATRHTNYKGHNPDKDPVIKAYENIGEPYRITVSMWGDIVFCTWPLNAGAPTVHRYEKATGKTESGSMGSLVGYHEISGFLQQKKTGRWWIYGNAFLVEWTKNKEPFNVIAYQYRYEPKYEYNFQSFEDRQGNIWMATDNGIYYFSPDEQIFNSYSLLRPGGQTQQLNVTAAQELDNKNILVGCWGGRLFYYDQNFNPLPLPNSLKKMGEYASVWDMAINSKTRDVWVVMQAAGILVYNQKTGDVVELHPEIFQGSTIRQIDEDTSGNLWFGTQNGRVIKWDFKKSGNDPTKGYELIYRTGQVQKIHYDYQGYIWVGALGYGLTKIDAKTGKLVKTFTSGGKEGERLFNDLPYDMSWYNDSTLIVIAGCINIVNTKTNKIHFITADDGLPSNTGVSVQKDRYGVLWVGMTNGVCRVNLAKKIISYYDSRDGIAYDKLIPAGVSHLSDGRIIFFTEHDFLSFDPQNFGQSILPPQPFLTSFKLQNQYLSLDSLFHSRRVILKYDNTSIAISFSALSYLQQRKVHYYYKMEGLDKDWIHTDHPMGVIYNSLAPGEYVFKVKSENADGMTSPQEASILIVVRPPFWETWWFYSLVALTVIAVLYLIDRERIKRRESLANVRRQIRANLKDEISKTLNNINVLSEIAKIKADKNVVQSKEFIDQISDKSRYMNEVLDDTIWSIDPANDSMKKFVLRIKELTEGLQASHGVSIDLIVDNKVQALELDMKLRYELLFFYKEALNFIIENTRCDQVFVNINRTRSKLYMEILSECGAGSDLRSQFEKVVHRRVKALSATMDVLADSKSFSSVLYIHVR